MSRVSTPRASSSTPWQRQQRHPSLSRVSAPRASSFTRFADIATTKDGESRVSAPRASSFTSKSHTARPNSSSSQVSASRASSFTFEPALSRCFPSESRVSAPRASSSTQRLSVGIPNVNHSDKLFHTCSGKCELAQAASPERQPFGQAIPPASRRAAGMCPEGSRTSTIRASSFTAINYSIVISQSYCPDRERPNQTGVSPTSDERPLPAFLRRFACLPRTGGSPSTESTEPLAEGTGPLGNPRRCKRLRPALAS